ncbi:hypothetical protein CR513_24543, partial [Mucuna pruriens]
MPMSIYKSLNCGDLELMSHKIHIISGPKKSAIKQLMHSANYSFIAGPAKPTAHHWGPSREHLNLDDSISTRPRLGQQAKRPNKEQIPVALHVSDPLKSHLDSSSAPRHSRVAYSASYSKGRIGIPLVILLS